MPHPAMRRAVLRSSAVGGRRRALGRAYLQPTAELLEVCPFNPTRSAGNNALESCILRRDVQGRTYGARTGGVATAIEVLAAARLTDGSTHPKDATETRIAQAAAALTDESEESKFLASILGASAYTAQLAPAFARALNQRYALNGRFRRAYWINPGYEWTPTQTAGKSRFQVSQKVSAPLPYLAASLCLPAVR
eukprot:2260142-Rhodomonas_salina.3